jgi:hypothetical protein
LHYKVQKIIQLETDYDISINKFNKLEKEYEEYKVSKIVVDTVFISWQ